MDKVVVSMFKGFRITVSEHVAIGQVAVVAMEGQRVLVCNERTLSALKEEIVRRENGEPSFFSALWEEYDNPVI